MKKEIVICDIDGCLIDTAWIFDKTGNMQIDEKWDFFNRNANNSDNKINFDLVNLIDKLKCFAGYKIFFVTSRSDIIYRETLRMLKGLFSHEDIQLLMRREGDTSESREVKELIINKLREEYRIICAIDDDPANCKMFKDNGILTMQIV